MKRYIFLFFVFIAIFLIRLYFVFQYQNINWKLFMSETEIINTEGIVISEPEERKFNIKIEFEVLLEGRKIKLISYLPKKDLIVEDIRLGDKFLLSGTLSLAEPDSYKKFLASRGISGIVFVNEFNKIDYEKNFVWKFVSFLTIYRQGFVNRLERLFPSPESGLAAGILLGVKKSFSERLLEDFRLSGLTHIIVLSGFNVSIVAISILFILKGLPKSMLTFITIISLIVFSVFVGGGMPVIRSVAMSSLALISRMFNRQTDIGKYLFITGAFISILNPFTLLFDPSFQLSFLATFGIIYISPCFQFKKLYPAIREIIGGTISTTISTAPILIYQFHQLSLLGLITNILVLPVIPLAMALSFIAIFIPNLSLIAFIPLKWIIFIAKIFSKLTFLVIRF